MGSRKPISGPTIKKEHIGFNFFEAYFKNEKPVKLKPYNGILDDWNNCYKELKFEEENKMSETKSIRESVENCSKELAKKLISERTLDHGRMGINDDMTNTNLISKNFSPLTVRKYNAVGMWPLWIGLIVDESLSDLDFVVNGILEACEENGMFANDIQQIRNITGILSEGIKIYYNGKKKNCVEGIAIALYVDKNFIQNFAGDFMNHTSCRIEWAGIMSILPHI